MDDDCSHEIKTLLLLGRKAMRNLDSVLKIRDMTLPTKVHLVKAMVFPVVIYIYMWELNRKEAWVPKNWCFRTVVLENTLESLLDIKEIEPVNPTRNQPWIFIGRTDTEIETPIIWTPKVKKTHWKRLWCWKILKAGGEGDDRAWDGWMASPTRWTWV